MVEEEDKVAATYLATHSFFPASKVPEVVFTVGHAEISVIMATHVAAPKIRDTGRCNL